MVAQSVLVEVVEVVEEVGVGRVLAVEVALLGMLDIVQIPVRVGNSSPLVIMALESFPYLLEHSGLQKVKAIGRTEELGLQLVSFVSLLWGLDVPT